MEKGEIIPHPDEGPLVQAIFSKYLERAALSTLAKYASLSGIPYREGAGQWNKTMICRILDNSKYAGDEGFPPLVSKEQWEEAAFLRAAKAKQYGGSLPAEMKKIRQKICCGNCEQILKRVNMRTGYILSLIHISSLTELHIAYQPKKERLCIKQSLSSAWNDFYLLFYFRKNKVNRIPCGEFIGSKT